MLADEAGKCTRTIYDNLGRIIQEIVLEDYEATKEGVAGRNADQYLCRYDTEDRITGKSYGDGNLNFVNSYDEEDRITTHSYDATEWDYFYDEHSQLTRVNSNFGDGYTTVYNYDDRGNILSKKKYDYTEDEITDTATLTETKTFTYNSEGWKDLLVQVDDKALTYDANGNVRTYGDRTFTWERGRILSQITEGENTYTYTYDADGIRTSKTVNGVTTYYNIDDGVILSQSDGTTTMLFQYDSNGALAGFTYNGTQYYYITNQMGGCVWYYRCKR